jgi:serine phosphatase RsbU (regulator of sigma subunit)/anti-anti-sigma regulatory factor
MAQNPSTILVVDDDLAVRTLLVRALKRGGYDSVLEAACAAEAQEILSHSDIQVVLTDVSMPGMDGLSLMQWAQQNCPGPVWIILTGQGTFDNAVKAVRLGAFDFLTKPLMVVDSLLVTVRNAIRHRELIEERRRLMLDIEQRNGTLNRQVVQLKKACRMLCDQTKIINDDIRRAELIQRSLLPRSAPPVTGFVFNAVYRPSQKVGGDLYDIQVIDPDHVGICIADAAGHGVSAAMLAVLLKLRMRLRDENSGGPVSPGKAMDEVNRAIMGECIAPGLFITAAYCLLNTTTGGLTIASAGHPPLMLHRPSGVVEMCYHTGPALGLVAGAGYAEFRSRLRPGDRLLFYTDGLRDGVNNRSSSFPSYVAGLFANPALDGRLLLQSLLDASKDPATSQEDDITAVLLTSGQGESFLDNGEIIPARASAHSPALPDAGSVLMGQTGGQEFFAIQGRGNWTFAMPFHEACKEELKAGRDLVLDLARCAYLDSTFLGTILEIVYAAKRSGRSIAIQSVLPQLRQLFEELRMDAVLAAIATEPKPLPALMAPIGALAASGDQDKLRILEAHEALSMLSEHNREEFSSIIELIQAEIKG